MSVFGSYTRDQLRQSYTDAWRKRVSGTPLSPLEALLANVIEAHPEYHPLLDAPTAPIETSGVDPAQNPFLHFGLHVAVREQISIDRPPGVRDLHRRLQARCGDAHGAEHILMESLAQTLWEAQRAGRPPDESQYLKLARKILGG